MWPTSDDGPKSSAWIALVQVRLRASGAEKKYVDVDIEVEKRCSRARKAEAQKKDDEVEKQVLLNQETEIRCCAVEELLAVMNPLEAHVPLQCGRITNCYRVATSSISRRSARAGRLLRCARTATRAFPSTTAPPRHTNQACLWLGLALEFRAGLMAAVGRSGKQSHRREKIPEQSHDKTLLH